MITAEEIARELEDIDPKIDEVIQNLIKPKFLRNNYHSVMIPFKEIQSYYGFGLLPLTFMNQMRRRGFVVTDLEPNHRYLMRISLPREKN